MSLLEDILAPLDPGEREIVNAGLTPFASDPDALAIVLNLVGRLNPEQLAVAVHPIDGPPILVLGGAGSGKTATLTRRLVYLVLAGIPPSSIFAVTFTRKAAREMAERTRGLIVSLQKVARPPYDAWLEEMQGRIAEAWITTFHSAGLGLLRDVPFDDGVPNLQRLGYGAWSRVIDETERNGILAELIDEFAGNQRPEEIAGLISNAKGSFIYPEGFHHSVRTRADEVASLVYPRYQAHLEQRGLLDFDDLIFRLYELFEKFPEILSHYQDRFQSLLIDEYQDTNLSQYLIGSLLAGRHRRIMAVGDDDQSIYGWRGADVTNITRFIADYPDIRIVKLVRNYRSDGTILAAANAIWKDKPEHLRKELIRSRPESDRGERIRLVACETELDEARYIALAASEALAGGQASHEIAVLVRAHHLLAPVGAALTGMGLPWVQSGVLKGLARPEVVGAIAFLETVTLAVRRVTAPAAWHIGDAEALAHALREALAGPGFAVRPETLPDLLQAPDMGALLVDAAERERLRRVFAHDLMIALDRVAAAVRESMVRGDLWTPSSLLNYTLALAPPPVLDDPDDPATRAVGRLRELALIADTTPGHDSIQRILNFTEDVRSRAGLGVELGESAPDADASGAPAAVGGPAPGIQLMTLHAAKGLEFNIVFLPAIEDGILPQKPRENLPEAVRRAQADEEKRLFYVGVSRARQVLHLSHTRRRRTPYGERSSAPSPLLDLIPKDLVEKIKG